MNRAPSFQLYPDKFIAGTLHLGDKAFKSYTRMLCWMWLHGDPPYSILNEHNSICLACGLSKRLYFKVWENEIMNPVQPLLKIEGKYLISNGLRKEYDKQEARRKSAKAGANARWQHKDSIQSAMPNVCTPSTTPIPTTITATQEENAPLNIHMLVGAARSLARCKNAPDTCKAEIQDKLDDGYTMQSVSDAIKVHEGGKREWMSDILNDCKKPREAWESQTAEQLLADDPGVGMI